MIAHKYSITQTLQNAHECIDMILEINHQLLFNIRDFFTDFRILW